MRQEKRDGAGTLSRLRKIRLLTPAATEGRDFFCQFWHPGVAQLRRDELVPEQAHNHDVGDQAVTDLVFENVRIAFEEDHRVFEDQQRTIDLVGERARMEVSVGADAGALHAMRILDRLLAEQRDGKPAMVTPADLAWGPH